MLGDNPAIGINIAFHNAAALIQLHQYYRQIPHNVNNIFAPKLWDDTSSFLTHIRIISVD